MSKIQGKQIAESTITQSLLNLATPLSGDTTSGATVGYVNARMTGGEAVTIGPAEDGDYTDGIFTDFTTGTTVGVAVDRFNEMFKLLAPTPPSGNWTGAFGVTPVISTSVITARIIGTGASTAGIVTSTLTPAFTISSTVGTGINARTKDGTFVFTLKDYNGSVIETTTINSSSTTKSTGTLRYVIADPYAGVSGQAGFWTGCTGFSGVSFTTASITAGVTPRNVYFEHPTGQSKTGVTFYVDNTTHSPAAVSLSLTIPTMTRYISGVPSLSSTDTFTNVGFSINNVSSYFYAPLNNVWRATGTRITTQFGEPDAIPTSVGETATVSNKTLAISAGYLESMDITITPFNRSIAAGTTTGVTYGNLRIDTVSNESSRLTSGSGSYPLTGWGGTWGSNSGTSLLTLTDELQMLNGSYIYPVTNYTVYGGPNYSTASGTRYVTLNLGNFNSNAAFTLNFIGSAGITSIGQANLSVEVKISGQTYWVDGDAAYGGTGNPGSIADGTAAVVVGSSTATSRRITFGSITYTGAIIVRVGFTGSGPSFTSLTATSLV